MVIAGWEQRGDNTLYATREREKDGRPRQNPGYSYSMPAKHKW